MPAGQAAVLQSTLPPDEVSLQQRKLRRTKAVGVSLALLVLLGVWQLLAEFTRPWVPSPYDTAMSIWKALHDPQFYQNMMLTWWRLLLSFVASTLIGVIIGFAMGLSRKVEAFFAPLLALALAVPDPVYIIFAALGVGTGELAGFIALTLAVTPFVINVVRASVHARDRTLDEMATVYRLPPHSAFRHALVPQIVPALITAGRFSFALSWKIVILVEALTYPLGIGDARCDCRVDHFLCGDAAHRALVCCAA
jgi:NitT/TauT family transport system permease protein